MSDSDKSQEEGGVWDAVDSASAADDFPEAVAAEHDGIHAAAETLIDDEPEDVEYSSPGENKKLPIYIAAGVVLVTALGIAGTISYKFLNKRSAETSSFEMERPIEVANPIQKSTEMPGGESAARVAMVAASAPVVSADDLALKEPEVIKPASPVAPEGVATNKFATLSTIDSNPSADVCRKCPPSLVVAPEPRHVERKLMPKRERSAPAATMEAPRAMAKTAPPKAPLVVKTPPVETEEVVASVGVSSEFKIFAITPGSGEFPMAFLKQVGTGKTLIVREGERLPSGATVSRIDSRGWKIITSAGVIK